MGQCVTIEIGPKDQEQQIANHKMKGDAHASKSLKKHEKKNKGKNRDESSDEETTDEEVDDANALHVHHDENFGKAQSPINIVTVNKSPLCCQHYGAEEQMANPLKFNYPDLVRGCTIINTGHTVQVNIPSHSKCSVVIKKKSYQLKQFHFHTPSEHTLDNKQFEMEMHLVHVNDDGEIAVLGFMFSTKAKYSEPTLVMHKTRQQLIRQTKSIIMKHQKQTKKGGDGADGDEQQQQVEEDPMHQEVDNNDQEANESEEEDTDAEFAAKEQAANELLGGNPRERGQSVVPGNDFLEQFWDELPLKKTESEIRLSKPISFDYLFETAGKNFQRSVENNEIDIDMEIFEYDGSLTTPPFSEGVSWMLAKQVHFINVKQLNKLSSCWGHHNNARDCQEYCGRQVKVRSHLCLKGYFFN